MDKLFDTLDIAVIIIEYLFKLVAITLISISLVLLFELRQTTIKSAEDLTNSNTQIEISSESANN